MASIKTLLLTCVTSVLFQTILCTTANCCSLKEPELRKITPNPMCPLGTSIYSRVAHLAAKCDECPEGTCRVGITCYCPSDFLSSDGQQELCEFSFGENWPLSEGKEDTVYRSCVKEPPSTTTDDNCCSLTREQLETRVGTSNECPLRSSSTFSSVKTLSQKCDRCPFGTCRIGLGCFCPKDFLGSDWQHELCRTSFTEKWDESVGLEDRYWRSCVRPTPSESFTFDNCCAISKEQLEIRVGTNKYCPKLSSSTFSSVDTLSSQCDPCPFGSCRAGSSCYCPEDFLGSENRQELCRESFGAVHPDSVGKPDTFCPDNPPAKTLKAPKPAATSSEPATSTAPKPAGTSENSTDSNTTPSDSGGSSPGTASGPSQPSEQTDGSTDSSDAVIEESEGDKDGSPKDDSLSTAEIVGIVIGSVTGIISALGVVFAWCKRGKGSAESKL